MSEILKDLLALQNYKEEMKDFFDVADEEHQIEKDHIAEGRMEQEKLENGEVRYED